jgi:hypothetical protein
MFSIKAISTIVRRVWIYQRVIRIRKSKDRQHNGQKKDRQHNGQKKDRQHNDQNKRKGTNEQQRSTKLTYKTKQ